MGDSLLQCSRDVLEDETSEAGDTEDGKKQMETEDEVLQFEDVPQQAQNEMEHCEDVTQQAEEGRKQSEDEAQQAKEGMEQAKSFKDLMEATKKPDEEKTENAEIVEESMKINHQTENEPLPIQDPLQPWKERLNRIENEGIQAVMNTKRRNEDYVTGAETEVEHSSIPPEKRIKISSTSLDASTDVEMIGLETTPDILTSKTGHGNSIAQDVPMDLSHTGAQSDLVAGEEVTFEGEVDFLVSAFRIVRREDVKVLLKQHWNDADRINTVIEILSGRKSVDTTSRPTHRMGGFGEGQTEDLQKHASTALPGAASGASISFPSTSGIQHHHEATRDGDVAARMSLAAGPSSALETAASGTSGATRGLQQPNDSNEDLPGAVRAVIDYAHDADSNVLALCKLFEEHHGKKICKSSEELLSKFQKKREPRKAEKPQDDTDSPVEVKEEVLAVPTPLARGVSVLNDPLYKDVQTLALIFPTRDQNELYAYLEVHHDRPDRVERVVDELLYTASDFEEPKAGSVMMPKDVQDDLSTLKDMFPDCDPSFLEDSLRARRQDPERATTIATELSNGKPYPKLKDRLARERKEAERRRLWNLDMNGETFLDKFPDPSATFNNSEKPMGVSYREHCSVKLRNDFPNLKSGFIRMVLDKFNHHLTPAWEELQKNASLAGGPQVSKKFRDGLPPRAQEPYPEDPDEFFFHEVWFLEHKQGVLEYKKAKEQVRLLKVENAKAQNMLCTCKCCFDEEILLEEMYSCTDGHEYCRDCIRRYAQSRMSEAQFTFPCLEEGCKSAFPQDVLKKVLPPNSVAILKVRLQEQNVKEADIPDLVFCPFCPYATIMPNPDDKVFKCQNTECLKESCRLCRELNHIPLRCHEVEKSGEVAMRTFIENRISEAMLRTCPKCKRRFFKESGCNKMVCTCGTSICYVCQEPNINYDHFGTGTGKCILDGYNADRMHEKEMKKAAEEARKEYLERHPEAQSLTLKYDPDNHIKDFHKRMQKKQTRLNLGFPQAFFVPEPGIEDSDEDDSPSEHASDSDDSDGPVYRERLRRRLRNDDAERDVPWPAAYFPNPLPATVPLHNAAPVPVYLPQHQFFFPYCAPPTVPFQHVPQPLERYGFIQAPPMYSLPGANLPQLYYQPPPAGVPRVLTLPLPSIPQPHIQPPHGAYTGVGMQQWHAELDSFLSQPQIQLPHDAHTGGGMLHRHHEFDPFETVFQPPYGPHTGVGMQQRRAELDSYPSQPQIQPPHGAYTGAGMQQRRAELDLYPSQPQIQLPHGAYTGAGMQQRHAELDLFPRQPRFQPPHGAYAGAGMLHRRHEAESFPSQPTPPPAHTSRRSSPPGFMSNPWKPNYLPPRHHDSSFMPRDRLQPRGTRGETWGFRGPSPPINAVKDVPRPSVAGAHHTRDPSSLHLGELRGELTRNEGSGFLQSNHGETSQARDLTLPMDEIALLGFPQDDSSSENDLPRVPLDADENLSIVAFDSSSEDDE